MDETLTLPPKPLASGCRVNPLAAVMATSLELLPAEAYHFEVGHLGRSRRGTVLFNRPSAVKEIMRDAGRISQE